MGCLDRSLNISRLVFLSDGDPQHLQVVNGDHKSNTVFVLGFSFSNLYQASVQNGGSLATTQVFLAIWG